MTVQSETTARDYLAIILIGGGSSWARGSDAEDCIKRVARSVVDDWSSLFKLDGEKCVVNLYDVTGNDEVSWGHNGIKGDNPDPETIQKLELREVILPKRRRR